MKTKISVITIAIILFSITTAVFSQHNVGSKVSKNDITKIKKMMNQELCSDLKNCLYVINDSYCFWIREGMCSDNSYSYSLFGPKVKVLCYQRETIAGIDKKCNAETEKMFTTIIGNLQKNNLGLESSIKVKMVYSIK